MVQNLQILRAIAALLVVLHHFLLVNQSGGDGGIASFFHLPELGACGVDLFFCISGFVMLNSIASKATFSPIEFATGRIVRIAPAYWVATTLLIGLIALNHVKRSGVGATLAEPIFSLNYIFSSYLLVPAYNPETNLMQPFLAQGWTLSYELYFYVLLMCAALFAKAQPAKTTVLGAAFLGGGMLLSWNNSGVAGTFISNPIVLEFVLGMLVFQAARRTKVLGKTALVLGFALLAATVFIKVDQRLLIWGVPSALILYGFVAQEGKMRFPKLLKLIGDASYSLYLTHGMLTYVYSGLLTRGWFASSAKQNMAVLGGIICAVGVGLGFYFLIEKPLLNRFKRKRFPAGVPAAT